MGHDRSRSRDRKKKRDRSRSRDRDDRKHKKKEKSSKKHKSDKGKKHRRSRSNSSGSADYNQKRFDSRKEQARNLSRINQEKQEVIQKELGYTNESNPYMDQNLTKKFEWKKNMKNQDEIEKKGDEIQSYQQEIEQIKKQRAARQEEKERMDEEKNRAVKEREDEQFQKWMEKEVKFEEEKQKIRALQRLNFSVESNLDKLIKICYMYRGLLPHEKRIEAYMSDLPAFLQSFSANEKQLGELESMLQESRYQYSLNQEGKSGQEDYWESIISLSENILEVAEYGDGNEQMRKNIISKEFVDEVKEMYEGKDLKELEEFEKEVKQIIDGQGFELMDFEYWEKIEKCLKLHKAKLILSNKFAEYKKVFKQMEVNQEKYKKLQELREKELLQQDEENEEVTQRMSEVQYQKEIEQKQMLRAGFVSPPLQQYSQEYISTLKVYTQKEYKEEVLEKRKEKLEIQLQQAIQELQKKMDSNPLNKERILEAINEDDPDNMFVEKNEDQLYDEGIDALTQQAIARVKSQPLADGEEMFDGVIGESGRVSQGNSLLERPLYFNRVKMGYDWNKYNQAHFDSDNPPPRVIQGYRFTIFYTRLISTIKTPEYFVEEIPGDGEFFQLRFSSGPPYEDISFKILKKEWDTTDKKGFKSVFSKGILYLTFNFKRHRYRR